MHKKNHRVLKMLRLSRIIYDYLYLMGLRLQTEYAVTVTTVILTAVPMIK